MSAFFAPPTLVGSGSLTSTTALPPPSVTSGTGFFPPPVIGSGTGTLSNELSMTGGARCSGESVAFAVTHTGAASGAGGAACGGAADTVFIPNRLVLDGAGGAVCSGSAGASQASASGMVRIEALLPLIDTTITVADNSVSVISAGLSKLGAALIGGVHQVTAGLTTIVSSIQATCGSASSISARLPAISSELTAASNALGRVAAPLPHVSAALAAQSGAVATITARLPEVAVSVRAFTGVVGTIAGRMRLIGADIRAGLGGHATITARLPRVGTAITAQLETAAVMVMVVNTHTGAVSTYDNFGFNSYCELGGVYYGAGPGGLSMLETGDTDAVSGQPPVPISAGLSTGLLDLGNPHQKRITEAYMTLHTTGNLNLTVTADEGANHAPVVAPMTALEFSGFRQRRIVVPKGLRGMSWQFEISNLLGDAFDFGHIALNFAASARRI